MGELSKQFISSIPITHMSRLQWIQFKDAIERLHGLEEENGRLKAPVSNEEWDMSCTTALLEGCVESDEFAYRDEINAIIAARAKVQP